MVTANAGVTWSAAAAPPAASGPLEVLHCDHDGSCMGVAVTGSVQDPSTQAILTLRSTNAGRTWTAVRVHVATGPGVIVASCGNSVRCMAAFPTASAHGTSMSLATTADGGATWTVSPSPPIWPSTAIALSCATGLDCFLSAATPVQGAYSAPAIEATHDAGKTWTALGLPTVKGSPLALVFPLSCPVRTGCVGIGATAAAFAPPGRPLLPAGWASAGPSRRVVLSNVSAPR